MRTPSSPYFRLDLAPPLADRFISGFPIDYGPVLLRRPFGFPSRWTPCPPKYDKPWLPLRLGCIRLSLSCPFRRLHTFCFLWPARNYPRLWIWRTSFERQRDSNPPEQRAAQHALCRCVTPRKRTCGPCGFCLRPPAAAWFDSRCLRGLPVLVHEVSRRAVGSS